MSEEVEIIEVLKEEQQQQKQDPITPKQIQPQQRYQRTDQNSKDRTLFCINIDQRCTEDILFELFLQAGPIDNLIRKPDRNGNIIALVTYKHLESVDYAIKLFDKILLFGQRLKVQLSQINTKLTTSNSDGLTSTASTPTANTSPNLISGYQKPYPRTQSYDNIANNRQQQQQQQMHAPLIPPQFMQMNGPLSMPLNLLQFMAQPLLPFNNNNNNETSPQQYHRHQHASPNNFDHNSRSHHHHHGHHGHHQNRSRDNSQQSDKRSRSPYERHRRR